MAVEPRRSRQHPAPAMRRSGPTCLSFGDGALRWADRRGLRPEALLVRLVEPLPGIGCRRGGAVEQRVEIVQADVPAGAVARTLAAIVQHVDERQARPAVLRRERNAKAIRAPD